MSDYTLYKYWLQANQKSAAKANKDTVISDFLSSLNENTAYQTDATRNGETQPIVAIRKNSKICEITVIPGDEMYIGDLVNVYGENWLVMELWTDEYGMTYGELWMCNQIFKWQNGTPEIIAKYAVMVDGSYSKNNDRVVNLTDSYLTCYMSLDDESKYLYIDKRLAIDVIYDEEQNQVLEVGKISYIDMKSKNFGEGSHLLTIRLDDGVYNQEKDNIVEMICDYIEPEEPEENEEENTEEEETVIGYLEISGRDTIRLGTGRDYSVSAINYDGNTFDIEEDLEWNLIDAPEEITISVAGAVCTVNVPNKETLSNTVFALECINTTGKYEAATKEVEVK